MHGGRAFTGTAIEVDCPCEKAPCGLVILQRADPGCTQHPQKRAKTMRQGHTADRCPGGVR